MHKMKPTGNLVLFHQNPFTGIQGGIERYIGTLLARGAGRVFSVTPDTTNSRNCFRTRMPAITWLPSWLIYCIGIFFSLNQVRDFCRKNRCTVAELSRPEYFIFAVFIPTKKVVTFHGTGPSKSEFVKYLLHAFSTYMCARLGYSAKVIGRDNSAIGRLAAHHFSNRIISIDAWFDDEVFIPDTSRKVGAAANIFYAGRIAPMKNPPLIFEIFRTLNATHPDTVHLHYFGSDHDSIPHDLRDFIHCHGLLSAKDLANALKHMDVGFLCSSFGEGSPFIVTESLAVGCAYVLPPLKTLTLTYEGSPGIYFTESWKINAYLDLIDEAIDQLRTSEVSRGQISHGISGQASEIAIPTLIDRTLLLAE